MPASEPRELKLAQGVLGAIVDHVRAEAPREAVGLLGGPDSGEATETVPLPNLAGHFAFFADPYAQFLAEKKLRAQALQVIGFYHSHPGGGGEMSAEDRRFATRADWVYVVVATAPKSNGSERVAAYRLTAAGLVEVPVT